MPCNCDHMAPTNRENESAKVIGFLQEIGLAQDEDGGLYGNTDKLDEHTSELCGCLQFCGDISQYSLEIQIWWRDHQKADLARLRQEQEAIENEKEKKVALSKLTPYERELLGL